MMSPAFVILILVRLLPSCQGPFSEKNHASIMFQDQFDKETGLTCKNIILGLIYGMILTKNKYEVGKLGREFHGNVR